MIGPDLYPPAETRERQPSEIWNEKTLNLTRIKQLITDITPDDETRQGRQYGLHVIDGQDESSDIGRFVEWTVLDEFFKNNLKRIQEEYARYDSSSTFLVVVDYEKNEPMGVLRIIRPSPEGLKSMNDLVSTESPWYRQGDSLDSRFAEIGDDPQHTVDIATMTVMPDYRTDHAEAGTSAVLYSSCVRWSLENNFNRWVTIVDKKIYDMMQSWGEPFTAFNETDWEEYLDSPKSLPVHTELYSGLEKIKRFDEVTSQETGNEVDIHGLYTQGRGLEEQFVLPNFGSTRVK